MSEKQLEAREVPNRGTLYEIKYQGGGQVPDCLLGSYTSKASAQFDIDHYVPARPKKVAKDGKTNS